MKHQQTGRGFYGIHNFSYKSTNHEPWCKQVFYRASFFYGMGAREEKEEKKEKRWGRKKEELEGIGLFGPFARISNSKEKAQPSKWMK